MRPSPRLSSLGTLAIFTGAAFAGGVVSGARWSRATTGSESPYAVVSQLARVLVQVENDYVDPVDRQKLLNGAIHGMVDGLDPHSSYMSPEDYDAFQNETAGQFGGLGIEVDMRGDMLVVIAPIEGSPAWRAGVKSGDRVVAVDGQDIERTSLEKMVKRMRGPVGSHVKLSVSRPGEKELREYDLERAIVHVPSVSSRLLDGGVAYVRLKQFQEHTHAELLRAAAKLRSRGALTGILLDLRSDPGGLVDQAADVADEFLNGGVIYTTRHRGEVVDEVKARSGGAFSTLPCVVLVDEWSASAAELLAGALQDNKRALIVGSNTFGKGSVQSILELPGGAGMRLTTARYYTPNGHSLQADGIHPDVLVAPAKPELHQLHERDLEGHLPAEPTGAPGAAPRTEKSPPVFTAPADAGAEPPPEANAVEGEEARVPADPEKGHDYALKVAYEALRHPPAPAAAASSPSTR